MFVLSKKSALAAASTSLFVLLWSSGAIFSKWGLAHASPFAFLLIRFAIALCGLVLLVPLLKLKRPKGGKPMLYAMATGVVLLGAYQIFYLLALDLKVTPGVMATIMGVQPILTVVIMERQRSASRMFGLTLAGSLCRSSRFISNTAAVLSCRCCGWGWWCRCWRRCCCIGLSLGVIW